MNSVTSLAIASLLLFAGGCGGDGVQASASATLAAGKRAQGLDTSLSQRVVAATATAQSGSNECAAIRPFYWEIGDLSGRLAGGSVDSSNGTDRYTSSTPLEIASASKWIYGAYVAELRGGVLSRTDRKFLSLRSGYVSLVNSKCTGSMTVDGCLAAGTNGRYTRWYDGTFFYNGGHLQKHASMIGLGSMDSTAVAAEIMSRIGNDVSLTYSSPVLAGGVVTSPDAYARFLRKLLNGELRLGNLLGSGPVCTNPQACGPKQAAFTPIPVTETWHYSAGHWIEDDPVVGDGAFSGSGTYGFYPWIDSSRTFYGLVARVVENGGFASVQCGRLVRKAWTTGVAL